MPSSTTSSAQSGPFRRDIPIYHSTAHRGGAAEPVASLSIILCLCIIYGKGKSNHHSQLPQATTMEIPLRCAVVRAYVIHPAIQKYAIIILSFDMHIEHEWLFSPAGCITKSLRTTPPHPPSKANQRDIDLSPALRGRSIPSHHPEDSPKLQPPQRSPKFPQ